MNQNDEAARVIRTAIEGSMSNAEAEQYAELDGQPPKFQDSGYADDWRSKQLPGYRVPRQYRAFAKGVEVWLVTITAEPTRTGVISRSVYRSERQGRGVWYYGFAAKARPDQSRVCRASDLANGIADGDYELRMPAPEPPRSNGKASTTAITRWAEDRRVAEQSQQERQFEVDQTGVFPYRIDKPDDLIESAQQMGIDLGQPVWVGKPCAECGVPLQPDDDPDGVYVIAPLRWAHAACLPQPGACEECADGGPSCPDLAQQQREIAALKEQLRQNGSAPLAQLQRDLDSLDWELVAAYREHEHANGYRLTYITLCKRLRPVFPEAPYVVSHWSGGDTLPSGFGGTHYDLTFDRAKQVYIELFSENVA